ncbi:MAG: glycoside hydrolase [Fodinibius sp.]|nr:glycoside hydrolase [Fodinibius sp.]
MGVILLLAVLAGSCGSQPTITTESPIPEEDSTETSAPVQTDVSLWLTKADQSALFEKQNVSLEFTDSNNGNSTITVDTSETYQTIDGFGFALTGGSAYLINNLSENKRTELLNDLFGTDSTQIGVSYLRVSIGSSDLNRRAFTYNDLSAGQTDPDLSEFDLGPDKNTVVPVLQEILEINPDIKILGSPWSAPAWMKTNNSLIGGSLKSEYYDVYAQYFVRYLNTMKEHGIDIDAITPQNEPMHDGNNPSMVMSAEQQKVFIRDHLGPALEAAGLDTKIIIWDHNADRPEYPLTVLEDPEARKYVAGSAFHLYAGDISALSQVHNAYPQKGIYFTEQYTPADGSFSGDLSWHMRNLIIGATRNWSRNVLEWNLANDPNFDPHTSGGCDVCKGALTIGSTIERNVSYYIIASASKFVRPGSQRIASNIVGNLRNVAFKTPGGNKVLIVLNDGKRLETFNIRFDGEMVTSSLKAGSVGTYVWK